MAAICPENIPAEIKAPARWCVYRLEIVNGRETKVPYQLNGQRASSTDSKTWAPFKAAQAAYQDLEGYDGLCFMLAKENGIVFIDLDNCIRDGVVEWWAQEIVRKFNSYTERSQSGKGLHILTRGTKPGKRCRKASYPHKIELYSHSRQCCLTGDLIDGYTIIEARQDELEELYREIFGEEKSQLTKVARPTHEEIPDDSLIKRAMQAKNGNGFKSLWEGSTLGYNGDDSAADMALMNMLAFWTCGNAAQMERLFSMSRLGKRDKWNGREDYRQRTIKKAISDAREFYEPNGNGAKAGQDERNAELMKAQELLKDLSDRIKADVNIIKDPAILNALATIKEMDRIDYDIKLDSVTKANKALKVKSINAKVEEHKSKGFFEADDNSKSPLEIAAERIPAWIDAHHFKTVADTERIYHYEHGVYLDDGEKVLKALIEAEFSHITTDYFSTAQLDVIYDPLARAPKIQKFLGEVAQSGDISLIEEIIGWLLWLDYHIHKAIMLLGPGRNGKGTLLRLLTAFLGGRNVCNVTLQDLVSDRFAKADLYGKLANIGGDLPSKDLSDTAAFRNLTGGDDVRAQEKYKTAFGFRNKAKMIFSANVLPRSPDDTYAFYSRWILIEFLNTFTVESGTADPDLDSKLQTSEELSSLLNIALWA
jgi:putative DNA primase/helicase